MDLLSKEIGRFFYFSAYLVLTYVFVVFYLFITWALPKDIMYLLSEYATQRSIVEKILCSVLNQYNYFNLMLLFIRILDGMLVHISIFDALFLRKLLYYSIILKKKESMNWRHGKGIMHSESRRSGMFPFLYNHSDLISSSRTYILLFSYL